MIGKIYKSAFSLAGMSYSPRKVVKMDDLQAGAYTSLMSLKYSDGHRIVSKEEAEQIVRDVSRKCLKDFVNEAPVFNREKLLTLMAICSGVKGFLFKYFKEYRTQDTRKSPFELYDRMCERNGREALRALIEGSLAPCTSP